MKRVIIIGGGPVGLTLANQLSKTLNVTVISPRKPFNFFSTSNSHFKLSPKSTSGKLFGNSKLWGSQHEGLVNNVDTPPIFSDLPGFPFELKELEKYEGELFRQGWPRLTSYRLNPKETLKGMRQSEFWKGKAFKTLPNFLNKKIDFIETEFDTIHFKTGNDFKLESITIDGIDFSADIFVFATGGLSNVALLSKLSQEVPPHQGAIIRQKLGVGYSNHPKSPFLRIRFHRPRYFSSSLNVGNYTRMKNWDIIDKSPGPRPLRVSTRLWPMYDDSNWKRALVSRLLGIFRYYTDAQLVVYMELPQISNNLVNFEKQKNSNLYFCFKYFFSLEIQEYLQAKLNIIAESISQNSCLMIIEEYQIPIKKIISEDANHHFGGTRMATCLEDGTVDSYSRCFGISNLFIVGTSTLPVSSSLHPTLLSAALALRAAEEICRYE